MAKEDCYRVGLRTLCPACNSEQAFVQFDGLKLYLYCSKCGSIADDELDEVNKLLDNFRRGFKYVKQ